jgi:hypothetical protein
LEEAYLNIRQIQDVLKVSATHFKRRSFKGLKDAARVSSPKGDSEIVKQGKDFCAFTVLLFGHFLKKSKGDQRKSVMKHLRNFIASSYRKAVITIGRGGQGAACDKAGRAGLRESSTPDAQSKNPRRASTGKWRNHCFSN